MKTLSINSPVYRHCAFLISLSLVSSTRRLLRVYVLHLQMQDTQFSGKRPRSSQQLPSFSNLTIHSAPPERMYQVKVYLLRVWFTPGKRRIDSLIALCVG